MKNPGRAGERAPRGADGSAGELAETSCGTWPALAQASARYRLRTDIIIAYVTYVSNVRYIRADQDMINIRYLASMPDEAINPYADEPLYVQLAGIVRRMIQSGQLTVALVIHPHAAWEAIGFQLTGPFALGSSIRFGRKIESPRTASTMVLLLSLRLVSPSAAPGRTSGCACATASTRRS